MMKTTALLIFSLSLGSEAFGQKVKDIPFKQDYFSTKSRVGILAISILESKGKAKGHSIFPGPIGLASFLVTSTAGPNDKYYPELKAVLKEINPDSAIIKLYSGFFPKKGKEVVVIREVPDFQKIREAETVNGNPYYDRIIQYMKTKYSLDQLFVIETAYGLYMKFNLGKETNRYGSTTIHTELLDFPGTKTVYRQQMWRLVDMTLTETPQRDEIINAVTQSTLDAIALEKRKLEGTNEPMDDQE